MPHTSFLLARTISHKICTGVGIPAMCFHPCVTSRLTFLPLLTPPLLLPTLPYFVENFARTLEGMNTLTLYRLFASLLVSVIPPRPRIVTRNASYYLRTKFAELKFLIIRVSNRPQVGGTHLRICLREYIVSYIVAMCVSEIVSDDN